MKVVINRCYGGFSIPDRYLERLGLKYRHDEIARTNPELVAIVEENGGMIEEWYSCLRIAEVPDDATDYEINDYDGYESITYVVDGKLHHI